MESLRAGDRPRRRATGDRFGSTVVASDFFHLNTLPPGILRCFAVNSSEQQDAVVHFYSTQNASFSLGRRVFYGSAAARNKHIHLLIP